MRDNEEPLFLAGSKKKRISPLEATDALTHESWNRKDSQVIFRTAEEGAEKKKQRDVLALSKPVNVAEPCS